MQGDLHRYAEILSQDCLRKLRFCGDVIENCVPLTHVVSSSFEFTWDAQLVYALAKNGLSFTVALNDHYEKSFAYGIPWPRSSQLIMLNYQADLLGALMDFDISLPSCAYDGVSVRVTPRSALSLITSKQFVTPFILEEKRNRSRIVKVLTCHLRFLTVCIVATLMKTGLSFVFF